MIDIQIRRAAARAANWLEGNPNKHLARIMATDITGHPVRPNDPKAECFCALGRLGREMGWEFSHKGDYFPFVRHGLADYDEIYSANDGDAPYVYLIEGPDKRVPPPDRSTGIAALRKLAAGE